MKKFRCTVIVIAVAATAFLDLTRSDAAAQSLAWAYSYRMPTNVQDGIYDIASNDADVFCIIGAGIKDVPMDVIGQEPRFTAGDSYIAMYDENANIRWLHPTAQPNEFTQTAFSVWMDADANVYVGGRIGSPVDFDPGPEDRTVDNDGNIISYVQKFTSEGSFDWVALAPGGGITRKIGMFSDGNILFGGEKRGQGAITFDGGITSADGPGLFLVEAEPGGRTVAAYIIEHVEGAFNFELRDLEIDANDDIIICGAFEGQVDFDILGGSAPDTSVTAIDAFVAKYDRNYNLLWQRRFGDVPSNMPPAWDYANALELDLGNNILVGGEFSWTTDFDPDMNPGLWVLEADDSSPSPDGFIMMYSPTGNLQWVSQIGGDTTLPDHNNDVTVTDMELRVFDLYITGSLTGIADFDPSAENFVLNSGPGANTTMFFGRYDDTGVLHSVFTVDAVDGLETATGIELIGNEGVVAAGRFQKEVDFDPGSGEHILAVDPDGARRNLDNDIFIARYHFSKTSSAPERFRTSAHTDAFPNPANGKFRIDYGSQSVHNIEVYDAVGRIVLTKKVHHAFIIDVNLEHVEPGVYFIRAYSNGATLTSTVMLY